MKTYETETIRDRLMPDHLDGLFAQRLSAGRGGVCSEREE